MFYFCGPKAWAHLGLFQNPFAGPTSGPRQQPLTRPTAQAQQRPALSSFCKDHWLALLNAAWPAAPYTRLSPSSSRIPQHASTSKLANSPISHYPLPLFTTNPNYKLGLEEDFLEVYSNSKTEKQSIWDTKTWLPGIEEKRWTQCDSFTVKKKLTHLA